MNEIWLWGGLLLTHGKPTVQLQVCSEEAGQAAKQLAAGFSSIQLIAAVHQAVRWASIVSFVQHAHQ